MISISTKKSEYQLIGKKEILGFPIFLVLIHPKENKNNF